MHAILNILKDVRSRTVARRSLVIGLFSVVFALVVSPAAAAGRAVWKSTTITEHTKKEAWYLELELHLNKAPDVGQKGITFEFTQTAEYERSLVDGRTEPQERTIPLVNQQSLIESQLVGFMDPGSGTIQKRTRFSFKVTRAHGYRAGQYQVKLKDSDSGQVIGVPTTLTFKGENPVVDRRSIVFQGESKKPKKSADDGSSAPKTITDLNAPDEPEAASSSPSYDAQDVPPDGPIDEGDAPPSVDERPGGGCHYGPRESSSHWIWGTSLLALGLVLTRRRRLPSN